MSERVPFLLLDPHQPPPQRRDYLAQRELPKALSSHREAAASFVPGDALCAAVNVALSVGAPLLLTGEPGTGKTQVAHYLAWYFQVPEALFQLDVRSTTTAEDLLYHFDHVAYFHAAHDPARAGQALARRDFVVKGPLWRAIESPGPSLVLIDEIDKAPRDFPNDILGVLDQSRFFVREQDEWIARRPGAPPPLVIITSNSERRLPEPLLRRCVFHHIEFNEALLRRAVNARRKDFPALSDDFIDAAVGRLVEIRGKDLRKRPATGELLVWLVALSAQGGITAERLRHDPLSQLPALSTLVKDRDDLLAL